MVMRLTEKEFTELRKLIIKINEPIVTEEFNKIFDKSTFNERKIKAVTDPIEKEIIIHVPPEMGVLLFSILNKHTMEIKTLSKHGVTIGNLGKWSSLVQNIRKDILLTFKRFFNKGN